MFNLSLAKRTDFFGKGVKTKEGWGGRQKLLSGFFPRRGGGTPPIPPNFFGHHDFPLRVGCGPLPNSAKEKNPLKNSYLWPKNANFSPF